MPDFLHLLKADRVISQLTSLSKFKSRVRRAIVRNQSAIQQRAKNHVLAEVYSTKPNPRYPRSRNLLAATFAKMDKDSTPDDATLIVGLDPKRANRPFGYTYGNRVTPSGILSYSRLNQSRGNWDYYPSYVRRGVVFRGRMPARDFMAAIRMDVVPAFKKLTDDAIRTF